LSSEFWTYESLMIQLLNLGIGAAPHGEASGVDISTKIDVHRACRPVKVKPRTIQLSQHGGFDQNEAAPYCSPLMQARPWRIWVKLLSAVSIVYKRTGVTFLSETQRTNNRLFRGEQNVQRVRPNNHVVIEHCQMGSFFGQTLFASSIASLPNCYPLAHDKGLYQVFAIGFHVTNVAPHFHLAKIGCRLDT